jgi:hypothetical protein
VTEPSLGLAALQQLAKSKAGNMEQFLEVWEARPLREPFSLSIGGRACSPVFFSTKRGLVEHYLVSLSSSLIATFSSILYHKSMFFDKLKGIESSFIPA